MLSRPLETAHPRWKGRSPEEQYRQHQSKGARASADAGCINHQRHGRCLDCAWFCKEIHLECIVAFEDKCSNIIRAVKLQVFEKTSELINGRKEYTKCYNYTQYKIHIYERRVDEVPDYYPLCG